MQVKTKQKDEISQEQMEGIVNQLETIDQSNSEDMPLELVSMLKQFCKRKHIAQHIQEIVPDYRNHILPP